MFTIFDFTTEKRRLTFEMLESPSTPDLTLLRQIYQDICILDEDLQYNPSDSDAEFWEKTNLFTKRLIERGK